jgi:hypothetical protein
MKRLTAVRVTFALFGLAACSSPGPIPMIASSPRPAPAASAVVPPPPASAVASSALPGFNASRIVAHRDSFAVAVGGQVVGYSVMALTREAGTFHVVTDNVLPPIVSQSENVVFNATTLSPLSYASNGTVQGMTVNSNVTITNGHAMGETQTPGPGGVKSTNIDMAISPDAISDDAVPFLVPALDLTDTYTVSFKTFDATPGEIVPTVVKVTGRETVTVPAGTFESFRVEVQQKTTSTLYVTVAMPHRLVLAKVQGGQVELRLIK